ncbi:MAG: AbgT family transporter [Treponema sp.]|nr:AbgT family transporter [Treponema sp.]
MIPNTIEKKENDGGRIGRILAKIETAGNKLPDPVYLFVIFSGAIILLSFIGSLLRWNAAHPVTGYTIEAFSLISRAGIARMFTDFGANIRAFLPLTDQMIVLLGLSVFEGTGLASALMRRFFVKMRPGMVTLALMFIAVNSTIASDAGFLILPPLAAILFLSTGRNPIAGIIAAYGTVAAGFAASYFIGIVEVVGLGITQTAARLVDPDIVVPITSNYFFTVVCATLLPVTAFFVTVKLVEPKLGKYTVTDPLLAKGMNEVEVSEAEKKGLRAAGIALVIYVLAILAMVIPPDGILRHPETGSLLQGPLMGGILVVVSGTFFFPGLVFGFRSGSVKNHRDVIGCMTSSYAALAGYILVAIFAGQLVQYFAWSNLGIIFAINGAEALRATGAPNFLLLVLTVLFVAMMNFLIPSHAAKLGFLAPILIPLFMMLNISPAGAYLAFRIGDSVTNAITPLMPYFVLTVGHVKRYKKDAGIGTLLAYLLPFTVSFLIVFLAVMSIFYFFNLPLGPGAYFGFTVGG